MRGQRTSDRRVVDASVMPNPTNREFGAPAMMFVAKASDLMIRGQRLPPKPVRFRRHAVR